MKIFLDHWIQIGLLFRPRLAFLKHILTQNISKEMVFKVLQIFFEIWLPVKKFVHQIRLKHYFGLIDVFITVACTLFLYLVEQSDSFQLMLSSAFKSIKNFPCVTNSLFVNHDQLCTLFSNRCRLRQRKVWAIILDTEFR